MVAPRQRMVGKEPGRSRTEQAKCTLTDSRTLSRPSVELYEVPAGHAIPLRQTVDNRIGRMLYGTLYCRGARNGVVKLSFLGCFFWGRTKCLVWVMCIAELKTKTLFACETLGRSLLWSIPSTNPL